MPKITKQNPKQASNSAPSNGSVASRIQPVESGVGGIKLLTYGRGKTGKTRLASTFPKPLLIVGTEDGTKSIIGIKGIDFIRLRTSSEVDEVAALLREGKYASAVLDTGGGLQDLILKEVLGLDDIPVQKSWGMTDRQTWGVVGAQFKERMRSLIDLADTHGINVVVIAHERSFKDDDDKVSDLVFPTVGAALTPSAAGWLNAACDYICQTFVGEQTTEAEIDIGGTKVKQTQKTGKIEYCLRVGPHPVMMTGFRLPPGYSLPDFIVDPSYAKIVQVIKGEFKSKH